ncbi:MAG: T9SS type A sorting domain-containing protein [bacterium]|nr:T9SS type A sorting domain-containing protein [bacterium]
MFDKTAEGDIYYLGILQDGLYESPILWVDAPLTVGKIWTDSRQVDSGGAGDIIHYVFSVLNEEEIVCPGGTYECFQVFMTVIYPDGTYENSSFWYNYHCGLIRCCVADSPRFQMYKSYLNPRPNIPVEPHESKQNEYLINGLLSTPNPANPTTAITFELKQPAAVDVDVFDISGRLIKHLTQGEFMSAGPVSIRWQGKNELGQAVASGTYLFKVKTGQTVFTNRITLIR